MVMYANIIFVIGRSGGMADALDSKSSEHPLMRVRVPPSAPNKKIHTSYCVDFYLLLII
jgi:hypothetical protein